MVQDIKNAVIKRILGGGNELCVNLGLPENADIYQIRDSVTAHFASLPTRYSLSVDVEAVVQNMSLLTASQTTHCYAVCCSALSSPPCATAVTISCPDKPKIYNIITAALDRVASNILEADILTTTSGLVLDRFVVNLDDRYAENPTAVEEEIGRFLSLNPNPPLSIPSSPLSSASDSLVPHNQKDYECGYPLAHTEMLAEGGEGGEDTSPSSLTEPSAAAGLAYADRLPAEDTRLEALRLRETASVPLSADSRGLLRAVLEGQAHPLIQPQPSTQRKVETELVTNLQSLPVGSFPEVPTLRRSDPIIEAQEQMLSPQERTGSFLDLVPADVMDLEEVGRGLSSVTYTGIIVSSGQRVALKKSIAQQSDEGDELILREVALMRGLEDHRNVCRVVGASTAPPEPFLCYEYLSGGTLWRIIHDRARTYDYLKFAIDVSCGMRFLHSKGILHRDLKSANVLLDADGYCKVADFGLSCLVVPSRDLTAETGTYRWMAPEVIRHEAYSFPADVYSFGVLLWELVVREQPYANMTPIQAAFGVAKDNLRPGLTQEVPPRTRALMQRCWHPMPSMRPPFQEITELLPQLR